MDEKLKYYTIEFLYDGSKVVEGHFVTTEQDAYDTINFYCKECGYESSRIVAVNDSMPDNWLDEEEEYYAE